MYLYLQFWNRETALFPCWNYKFGPFVLSTNAFEKSIDAWRRKSRTKFSWRKNIFITIQVRTIGQDAKFTIVALVACIIIANRHKRIEINSSPVASIGNTHSSWLELFSESVVCPELSVLFGSLTYNDGKRRSSWRRKGEGGWDCFHSDWNMCIYRADMWIYLPQQRRPRRFWLVVWSWGK